jgi:hypothetical protein
MQFILRTEQPAAAELWHNPAARHRLPPGVAGVVQRCLAAEDAPA